MPSPTAQHHSHKSNSKPLERVVIAGTGTVTPQACSTWGTALALRFRKTAWCAHETVVLPYDADGVVLRGATVSRLPEALVAPELDGAERAVALLSPAVKDCLAGLSPEQIQNLDFWIDNCIEHKRETFYKLLCEAFPFLPPPLKEPLPNPDMRLERTTFFERITTAAEELSTGRSERILIGCVDSLCATTWLMKVRDDRILKDSLTPEGIIAGEAAGAVLLERESTARQRKAPVLAVLASWGRGTEANSWYGTPPAAGSGLTESFLHAFSGLRDGGASITTVVADLNGQRHRALDWAYAEGRVFLDRQTETELRLPLFLTGDCGGATGTVLLADALGRIIFHPGFGGRVAMTTSDESKARRVIVLEPGDRLDRDSLFEQIRMHAQQKPE